MPSVKWNTWYIGGTNVQVWGDPNHLASVLNLGNLIYVFSNRLSFLLYSNEESAWQIWF